MFRAVFYRIGALAMVVQAVLSVQKADYYMNHYTSVGALSR